MEKHLAQNPPAELPPSDYKDIVLEQAPSQVRDVGLGQILEAESSPQLERRVVRKIDWIMIPLMGFCYMLQFMDKVALSVTTLFGIRDDLNLRGQQYSWASGVFYFGYLAWSWPSSYMIVKFPIGKYLAVSTFLWGGVLMCHAACTNFAGLMTARFFLGVGEAAIAPGFAMITGMFYKRNEQPSRQAAWFVGNSLASILGNVICYGVGKIPSAHVYSWQYIFLIMGAITSAYSLVLFWFLPDSPSSAVFLKKNERIIALQRTVENQTGILEDGKYKMNQVWLALKDPQTWFLVVYTFCTNLCNGGITNFSAIIVEGFGFGTFKTLLVQMPMGATQLIFLVATAAIATLFRGTRIYVMMFNCVVSIVGYILIYKLDSDNRVGKMAGLCMGSVFAANIPFSLSLISSNVAGLTKKAVVSAMLFVAYCVGNIIGPQLYLASQEPTYETGIRSAIAGLSFAVFSLVGLYVYYGWENRRRDRVYGSPDGLTTDQRLRLDLANVTDKDNHNFRYVL